MYTSFYNLGLKPFQISPDPAFMWAGNKHKEALATLQYGILNNMGFLLLTGDVGTGKTTLINALIQNLGDDIIFASVPDSNLEFIDFINYIAFSFGMNAKFKTKGQFVIEFRKFLLNAHQKKKKVLLIIDEAQLLTDELLEEIRLLSNIDLAATKLLNIFFVGQNEFNAILSRDNNLAVRQRLTMNYNLEPLTLHETTKYIKYRLKIAGTTRKIFSPRAIKKIYLHSKGFPRKINIICDHCMLSGYVNGKKAINISIVNECVRELEIPLQAGSKLFNFFLQPLFFLKDKLSELLETPKKTIGYLLIAFIFWLSIIATVSFFQHPAITNETVKIINSTESPVEAESKDLSNQSEHKEKAEKVEKKKTELHSKEAVPPIEIKKIIVRFKHNTNELTANGIVEINAFADILKKYPDIRLIVTGYTDSIGHSGYNTKLSRFRANIVKSFLMGKGIKPEQIKEKGLGSKNPVASNDTSAGRKMNRRVEVEIYQNNN